MYKLEDIQKELFNITTDDLLSDNSHLTKDQKDLIAYSITRDWSMPEYKLKQFVGNSQIHPYHKLKQYFMELNIREEGIENFLLGAKKLEIEIELEKELIEAAIYKAEIKLHELEILKKERELKAIRSKLVHTYQDRFKIIKAIEDFNNSSEAVDSQGRKYSDLMSDPIESEKIEKEYWEMRLAKQAAMDMVAYGRIGTGNMEAILQMEGDSQNKAISMAYEILLQNEYRMIQISDNVQEKLKNNLQISNISNILNIKYETNQIQEKNNVPLIQKC